MRKIDRKGLIRGSIRKRLNERLNVGADQEFSYGGMGISYSVRYVDEGSGGVEAPVFYLNIRVAGDEKIYSLLDRINPLMDGDVLFTHSESPINIPEKRLDKTLESYHNFIEMVSSNANCYRFRIKPQGLKRVLRSKKAESIIGDIVFEYSFKPLILASKGYRKKLLGFLEALES